ncbi:TPA: hypothetical protein I7707_20155, partial [Vibrio vulnificus]|nr:hypothetical protein [Vibrio vulnificus]HAS8335569.1 hypothetical protein [Vibrio vulnificus]
MNTPNTELPTVERIKQRAKKLKKEMGISHSAALTQISNTYGFDNWTDFQKELKKGEHANLPTPPPTTDFVAYDDIDMNENDYELLDLERIEELPTD